MREPEVNSWEIHITLSNITKHDARALAHGVEALVRLKADEEGVLYALALSHVKVFESNG
jgi:hypothetical protein